MNDRHDSTVRELVMTDITEPPGSDRIEPVDLQLGDAAQRTSTTRCRVIVGRALPEVRDGSEAGPPPRDPVRDVRRRLPPRPRLRRSAARVVGEVMGNFHPHGDTAIYDALVRLVQPVVASGTRSIDSARATSAPRAMTRRSGDRATPSAEDGQRSRLEMVARHRRRTPSTSRTNYDGQHHKSQRSCRRGSPTSW